MLESFKDLYEVRKTERIWLTQPNKKWEKISHLELNELVKTSLEIIKSDIDKDDNSIIKNEKNLIENSRQFVNELNVQFWTWKNIYKRYDLISVNKDYYRILARKAKFDAFWKEERTKYPKANQITLSSLQKWGRKEKIIEYWKEIIERSYYLISIFTQKLDQYENAVSNPEKLSHTKPDFTDFRKIFLQLLKVSEDYLKPLFDKSINFKTWKKSESEEDIKEINLFISEENNKNIYSLLKLWNDIREYFEENWAQVPYKKVSLNYYTAVQKPNNFEWEIKKSIKDLWIIEFLKEDEESIKCYLEKSAKEKIEFIQSSNQPYSIKLIQLFKPKEIPFSVKYNLAKFLEKNYKSELNLNYDEILDKLNLLWKSISIGKDYEQYSELEKENFSLEKYPIKTAFDYAWENLAKSLKREDVNCPEKLCQKYLKENFNVNINSPSFQLYTQLQFIADNLATIEYNNPNNEEEIIEKIKETFEEITFPYNTKIYNKYKKDIIDLLNQEKHLRNYKNIIEAKEKLWLLRWEQKSKIKVFSNLISNFKNIASFTWNNLATIRDGLKEENELNKISDYWVIIEDSNQDKYLLTLELNGKDIRDRIRNSLWNWEYKTYEVNSFTSKALNKFIKNPLSEDAKKFHGKYWYKNKNWDFTYKIKNVSEYDEQGKWIWYQEEFLNHIKKCLIDSDISREQNWKAFGWNFVGCDNYEKIEKEIDSKWYQLTENYISKENLENLVNNENCLLFPIINQDISSKKEKNLNDFTKDFKKTFFWKARIHPEFSIFYRKPEEDHKKENKSWIINRFWRLQLVANIWIEFVPQKKDYKTKIELNKISIDQEEQNKLVEEFNSEKVTKYFENLKEYYIFWIDRGIKQLATLCITNKNWVIQDFDIYTKHFNSKSKKWEYKFHRKDWILDLTNLKIESDSHWNKFIVDLSLFEAKDENWNNSWTNKQNIKLKQLAYIRKLQYQMSSNEKGVLAFLDKYKTTEERCDKKNIKELITPYKEWKEFADLPVDTFEQMFENYIKLKNNKNLTESEKKNLIKLTTELDASESLKKWIVANMIWVIVHLMKKYDYKVKIVVENLNQSFWWQNDWLNEHYVSIKNNFMYQENLALAWLGTYHFFEIQLLKKLFKITTEEWVLHLVPSFWNIKNYFKDINKYSLITNILRNEKYTQFWIVFFVKPDNTSKKCPICLNIDSTWDNKFNRNYKESNIVYCKKCEFISVWDFEQYENKKENNKYNFTKEEIESIIEKNSSEMRKKWKKNLNLQFIRNWDENAAYNIWEKIR